MKSKTERYLKYRCPECGCMAWLKQAKCQGLGRPRLKEEYHCRKCGCDGDHSVSGIQDQSMLENESSFEVLSKQESLDSYLARTGGFDDASQAIIKEEDNMILKKRPKTKEGKLPGFIGPMDVIQAGNTLTVKITGFHRQQTQFSDMQLDCTMDDGSPRTIGLKEGSQKLDSFIDLLGENTDAWIGKSVVLSLQKTMRGNPTIVAAMLAGSEEDQGKGQRKIKK